MTYLKVRIIKIWDTDCYPGWAECLVLDAFGTEHRFRDKIPFFSDCEIGLSMLPCDGTIRCSRCGESNNMVQIDTKFPDHIESLTGQNLFYVHPSQLTNRKEDH